MSGTDTSISAAGDAEAICCLMPQGATAPTVPCSGALETTLVSCTVVGMDAAALRARMFEEGGAAGGEAPKQLSFTQRIHEQRKSTNLSCGQWAKDGGTAVSENPAHDSGHRTVAWRGSVRRRRVRFDSPAPAGVPGVSTVPIEELQVMYLCTEASKDADGSPSEVCSVVSVVHAGVVPGNDTFYTYFKVDILPAIEPAAADGDTGGRAPAVSGGCCHLRLSFKIKFHKPCNAILRSLIGRGTLQGMQSNAAGVLSLLRDEVLAVYVPADAKNGRAAQGPTRLPAGALGQNGDGGGAGVTVEDVVGGRLGIDAVARMLNARANPGADAPSPLGPKEAVRPPVAADLDPSAPAPADEGAIRLSGVVRRFSTPAAGAAAAGAAGDLDPGAGAVSSVVAIVSLHATAALLLCIQYAVGICARLVDEGPGGGPGGREGIVSYYVSSVITAVDLPSSMQQIIWTCVAYSAVSNGVALLMRRARDGDLDAAASFCVDAAACALHAAAGAPSALASLAALLAPAARRLLSRQTDERADERGRPDASEGPQPGSRSVRFSSQQTQTAAGGHSGPDDAVGGGGAGARSGEDDSSAKLNRLYSKFSRGSSVDEEEAARPAGGARGRRRRREKRAQRAAVHSDARKLAKGLSKRFPPMVWTKAGDDGAAVHPSELPGHWDDAIRDPHSARGDASGEEIAKRPQSAYDSTDSESVDAGIINMGFLSRTTTLNTTMDVLPESAAGVEPTPDGGDGAHPLRSPLSLPASPVGTDRQIADFGGRRRSSRVPPSAAGTREFECVQSRLSFDASRECERLEDWPADDEHRDLVFRAVVGDEDHKEHEDAARRLGSPPHPDSDEVDESIWDSRRSDGRRHARRRSRSESPVKERCGGVSARAGVAQDADGTGRSGPREYRPLYSDVSPSTPVARRFTGGSPSAPTRRRAGGHFHVEIFEHERKQMIYGFGSSKPGHLFPTDRCRWTDRHGQLQSQDFSLIIDDLYRRAFGDLYAHASLHACRPGDHPWIFYHPWTVDVSGYDDERVDEKGWCYGVNFGHQMFGWPPPPGKGRQRWNSFVRRRRWMQSADIVYIRAELTVEAAAEYDDAALRPPASAPSVGASSCVSVRITGIAASDGGRDAGLVCRVSIRCVDEQSACTRLDVPRVRLRFDVLLMKLAEDDAPTERGVDA